jgi:hypothetical protein
MAVKFSTVGMFKRTNTRGGLRPLRKRETPNRESARAERIEMRAEDREDLIAARLAMAEPGSHSWADVKRELGL